MSPGKARDLTFHLLAILQGRQRKPTGKSRFLPCRSLTSSNGPTTHASKHHATAPTSDAQGSAVRPPWESQRT
jgi:hypothetical protein